MRVVAFEVPLIVTHPASDNPYEKIFNESVADLAADRSIPLLTRNRADGGEIATAVAAADADIMGRGELAHLAAAGGLLAPASRHPQRP
jgi:methionyl-tRNA formyltransferase